MRPRFSIRWLLVLIAALALCCYVLFVRPTVIAHRFVDAIKHRDLETAQGLLLNNWPHGITPPLDASESIEFVYAEVLPRDWNDIWALQRKLILRVRRRDDRDGLYIQWTSDTDLVAHINGVKYSSPPMAIPRFKGEESTLSGQ
jgi:hypothetical protein